MKDSGGRHVPRRRRALVGLVLGALVAGFTLGTAAPAGAATTLGSAAATNTCNDSPYHLLQSTSAGPSYTVPAYGTLTSWSVNGGLYGPVTGAVQLEVWRPTGTGDYTLIFVSPTPEAIPTDGAVHTFALSPPAFVMAGDVIGLLVTGGTGYCLQSTGDSGDDVLVLTGTTVSQGDTVPGSSFFSLGTAYGFYAEVNIAANFVPFAPVVVPPPSIDFPQLTPGGGTGVTSLTPQIPLVPPSAPPIAPTSGAAPANAVVASPHFTG